MAKRLPGQLAPARALQGQPQRQPPLAPVKAFCQRMAVTPAPVASISQAHGHSAGPSLCLPIFSNQGYPAPASPGRPPRFGFPRQLHLCPDILAPRIQLPLGLFRFTCHPLAPAKGPRSPRRDSIVTAPGPQATGLPFSPGQWPSPAPVPWPRGFGMFYFPLLAWIRRPPSLA